MDWACITHLEHAEAQLQAASLVGEGMSQKCTQWGLCQTLCAARLPCEMLSRVFCVGR